MGVGHGGSPDFNVKPDFPRAERFETTVKPAKISINCAKGVSMPKIAVRAAMIRASVLAPLLRRLDEAGLADRLLRESLITRAQLADPYAPISLARYNALFEAAAAALRDPAIGLKLGLAVRPADLGPLGLLFTAAATPRAAVSRFSALLAALQGGTQAALQQKAELTFWTYRIDDATVWPRRQDSEFSMAAICKLLQATAGPGFHPIEAQFEHEAPSSAAAHERVFRAPLRFGQPANRLVFANTDLDRPHGAADPGLAMILERHIAELLDEPDEADDLVQSVRRMIGASLGQDKVTIERLAAGIGVSPRTLQRRLGESGTSLRRLLREHRQAMADVHIGAGQRSQASIAEALGYSDGTAFWRAFKAWTNTTPSAYRKQKGDV
jgi:AraC-like DNA-binding protein